MAINLKALGIMLGLGLAGATIAVVGRRRGSRLGETVRHREYAPQFVHDEIDEAADRARRAGAKGQLEFIGAGMTGLVFCDDAGKAFKVVRHPEFGTETVEEEAAWLRRAAQIPGVREHVVRGARYDKHTNVLIRECVRPSKKRDRRVNERKLWALHQRIGKIMRSYGWGAPEYKPDSYVYTRDRGPVLVDAGFAIRRGKALVDQALDILNHRRALRKDERIADLAWAIRMERGDSIPVPVANKLLSRLKAIDPSVEI